MFRVSLVVMCLLLITGGRAYYELEIERHFPRYPEEVGNIHAHMNQGHAEGSCISEALKLCPTRKHSYGYHLNEHLKCIIPKVDQLAPGCRASILDMEHCVGDIDHFCDGLGTHDTQICMEHHIDQLHEDCLSSYFMRPVHRAAGRSTEKYLEKYKRHEDEHQRFVQPHADL